MGVLFYVAMACIAWLWRQFVQGEPMLFVSEAAELGGLFFWRDGDIGQVFFRDIQRMIATVDQTGRGADLDRIVGSSAIDAIESAVRAERGQLDGALAA